MHKRSMKKESTIKYRKKVESSESTSKYLFIKKCEVRGIIIIPLLIKSRMEPVRNTIKWLQMQSSGVSSKFGFHQSSYINFKVEGGYFFCLYFHTNEAKLTVKPMYADELWWDIWDASENKMEPLSLHGTGAYSLPGQILTSYEIPKTTNLNELTNLFEQVFQGAAIVMSKFLTDNPDAALFYPDESNMDHDPDRLLYLIALIHNDHKERGVGYHQRKRARTSIAVCSKVECLVTVTRISAVGASRSKQACGYDILLFPFSIALPRQGHTH